MKRLLILLFALILFPAAARAQDGADVPQRAPIGYGVMINDTITDTAFFDQWLLPAQPGDAIRITMQASGGLAPLVGLLRPGGDLVARSEDGAVNGVVTLEATIPGSGDYPVVATRVGNEGGTTTGAYTLIVELLNRSATPAPLEPAYSEVTFVCDGVEVAAALTFTFARKDEDNGAYSLRVYGLDGFTPVIRVRSGEIETCSNEPADATGDVITLPGERPITLTGDSPIVTAQTVITSEIADDPDSIEITIGTTARAGRMFAALGGFVTLPGEVGDSTTIRLAPLPAAHGGTGLVYMVGVNNRLDPQVFAGDFQCDDAGRRNCDVLPPFTNAGVVFNTGVRVIGDAFDAGARLTESAAVNMEFAAFEGVTFGEYAVFFYVTWAGQTADADG